jgi:hypothetical protein
MKARHEFKHDEEYNDYLRVYFSAKAIQGIVSTMSDNSLTDLAIETIAKESVKLAAALIAELNKEQP